MSGNGEFADWIHAEISRGKDGGFNHVDRISPCSVKDYGS